MELKTTDTSDSDAAHIDAERGGIVPPLAEDASATRRHEMAAAAAICVHALVASLFLVRLPHAPPPPEPQAIPIEIVAAAPEKPKPEPKKEPEVQQPEAAPDQEAAPELPPDRPRTSGGESKDLASGQAAKAPEPRVTPTPTPEPKPAPPAPKEPEPQTEAALDPALLKEAGPVPVPFKPPPVPPKAERQAALPPSGKPDVRVDPIPFTGEGGGDPYLNSLRDTVIKHLIFPASSELIGVSGTAQYEIVLDREGHLLHAQLARSAGSKLLDDAGLRSILRSAPFGPLPNDVRGDTVGITVVLFMRPYPGEP